MAHVYNKLDSLDEMDISWETHKLPNLTQEKIEIWLDV